MNDQKFQNFIDLVTFDQDFIQLEKKLTSSTARIQELTVQLAALHDQAQHNAAKKREAQKQLAHQELVVKELQEKEEAKAQLAQEVASSKEHEAVSKELERIRFDRSAQEQKMVHYINKLETAQKECDVLEVANQAKIVDIEAQIAAEQELLKKSHTELSDLSTHRSAKVAQVPEAWMEIYSTMQGRVCDPVVMVNQDSCSACFYLISSKDLQLLKKQELLQCKDCYRFLYCEIK